MIWILVFSIVYKTQKKSHFRGNKLDLDLFCKRGCVFHSVVGCNAVSWAGDGW